MEQNPSYSDFPGGHSNFVKSEDGRVIYFPFGSGWTGYVVPDAEAEYALRKSNERYRAFVKRFAPFFSIAILLPIIVLAIVLFSFSLSFARPSIKTIYLTIYLTLGSMVVTLLLTPCAFICFAGWQVWGYERVGGDPTFTRDLRRSALAVFLGLVLMWLTLHSYDDKINGLKSDSGTFDFYPSLWPNFEFVILGGLILFPWILYFDRYAARIGKIGACVIIAFFALLEFTAAGMLTVKFFNPTPSLTIARDSIMCGTRTRWTDVAAITLVRVRRGGTYAKLWLKSPGPSPGQTGQFVPLSRQSNSATECGISDLQTDSAEVYGEIEAAWHRASLQHH